MTFLLVVFLMFKDGVTTENDVQTNGECSVLMQLDLGINFN